MTAKLAEAILAERPHPEQGYRSCLGLFRLAKRYGHARLEAACARALVGGRPLVPARRLDPEARPRPRARSRRREPRDGASVVARERARPRLLPLTRKGENANADRTDDRETAGHATARMAAAWTEQQNKPDTIALSFDERFGLLVDAELLARENKRLMRRLREAKLRIARACIEDIDYARERELDKAVVRQLATCRWVPSTRT